MNAKLDTGLKRSRKVRQIQAGTLHPLGSFPYKVDDVDCKVLFIRISNLLLGRNLILLP